MRIRMQPIAALSLLALGLAATACGGGEPAPVTPPSIPAGGVVPGAGAPPVAAVATATPTPEPEETAVTEYNYDPIGKRDPFRSLVVEELQNRPKPKTPLQQYDLDQLKIVGIIWGISNPKAMVQTPDGKGFVVSKGTPIGKGRGKVTRITQKEVVVSEEYRDFEGKLLVNETALRIKEEEQPL